MDLKRIAHRIAVGEEPPAPAGLQLKGPFGDKPDETGYEVEVSIPIAGGDEFFNLLRKSGLGDEEIEGLKEGDDYYTVTVEVEWDYTKPEPSVGWGGGFSLDGFEAMSINGIDLLNPKDRAAINKYIDDAVKDKENDWADIAERRREDARADAIIDSYDDY